MSDLAQYGEIDVWTSPLVTFDRGAGDCEDYAIAKFIALRQAGIAADDLRIVIMRDTIRGEDHAVAAARLDGHWLMLRPPAHGAGRRHVRCQELPASVRVRPIRHHELFDVPLLARARSAKPRPRRRSPNPA